MPNRRAIVLALLAAAAAGSRAHASAPAVRIAERDRHTAVPKLDLVTIDGQRTTLAPLLGHVVLLNFWASWCEPCMSELVSLNDLARSGATPGGVQVLGVNYMEGAPAVGRVVQEASLVFPVLRDGDGSTFKAWTSGVLPTSILIDRRGRARFQVEGALDWTGPSARRLLDDLLGEP